MIVSYRDPNAATGYTTPVPVVWERPAGFSRELANKLMIAEDLRNTLVLITRNGKAGDMQTTYEIVPNLNKTVYKDEIYVKDANLFGDFTAFGTIVMDKTYDEIMQFQMTGQFPVREKKQEAQTETPAQNYAPQAPSNQGYVPPQYNQTAAPQFETYVDHSNEPVQQTVTTPQFNAVAPQQPVQPAPNTWGQPTPKTAMPWDNSTQNAGGFERPLRKY